MKPSLTYTIRRKRAPNKAINCEQLAGEVFYESPTDVHIVSSNASDTQPAKLLVFYVKWVRS